MGRLGWDGIGVMPYGEKFRKYRKLTQQSLTPQAIIPFRDQQAGQARLLLKDLLKDSAGFEHHIHRYDL